MGLRLLPYQEEAVEFCLNKPKSILRLDTGLGKTCVAITVAKNIAPRPRVLVIAPAFLKANWVAEIKKWGGLKCGAIDWSIVSYTKCSNARNIASITKKQYDLVICDEAHYLKNWAAKRTKNIIKKILMKTSRVILMTATPYVRSAEDLHPLFSVCQPGEWGTLGKFREQFCLWKPNPYANYPGAKIWYGAKNAEELKERSRKFMFSRKKSDVLYDLPDKRVVDIELKVPEEFHLDNLERETFVNESGRVEGGLGSILSQANAELGIEKSAHVAEFIENSGIKRYCIFTKHREVARRFAERFDAPLITGSTPTGQRSVIIQDFQEKRHNILVATIGAIGVGVNLQSCSTAFFAELPWSYAELKQCEDRLHRIGQKNKVLVYRFYASETVDELIISQLNQKVEGEEESIGVY